LPACLLFKCVDNGLYLKVSFSKQQKEKKNFSKKKKENKEGKVKKQETISLEMKVPGASIFWNYFPSLVVTLFSLCIFFLNNFKRCSC